MVCTEGKTNKECSYLGGLVGWKRTKSHGGCVLNESAVALRESRGSTLLRITMSKMGGADC